MCRSLALLNVLCSLFSHPFSFNIYAVLSKYAALVCRNDENCDGDLRDDSVGLLYLFSSVISRIRDAERRKVEVNVIAGRHNGRIRYIKDTRESRVGIMDEMFTFTDYSFAHFNLSSASAGDIVWTLIGCIREPQGRKTTSDLCSSCNLGIQRVATRLGGSTGKSCSQHF